MSDLRVTTTELLDTGESVLLGVGIVSLDASVVVGGGVASVNSHTGVVVLTAPDVGAATTAQGDLADSAVQPGDLAPVATSGDYTDLTGTPTLGTAAAAATGDFDPSGAAAAAQTASEAYTDAAVDGLGGGAVDSVNGQTGTVVLDASDVSADPAGSAATAQTTAEGYTDTAIASEVARADGAYAMAAQGTLADSAVQPEDVASDTAAGVVELATNTEATTGTDTTRAVTPAGLKAAIDALIDGAPGALDTLAEIATQLSADESAVSALTTTVGGKAAKSANLSDLASAPTARTNLGLGNVDNTADTAKPVSTAQQTALDLKAPLASPALTGNPTAPTPTAGDNDTSIATTAFVTTAVAAGGGGGGSTIKDPRWTVLTGQTSIDEFNDDSLDAAWTRVDTATAGNAAWSEAGESLTYQQSASDASGTHALMRALSGVGGALSIGDGFIFHMSAFLPANYATFGILLADGITGGAGSQLFGGLVTDNTLSGSATSIYGVTNYATLGSAPAGRLNFGYGVRPSWWRIARTATSTYRLDVSPDSVGWAPAVAAVTSSVVWTHIGFFGSTFNGGATKAAGSVDCIRRVSGVS